MIKRILQCVREYKKPTIITVFLMVGEAAIETLIPFITANLVNQLREVSDIKNVIMTGALLVVMAMLSLCCGGFAAVTCAKASSGFSKNLRNDIFDKIQTYSLKI